MAIAALLTGATVLVVPSGAGGARTALQVEVSRRATEEVADWQAKTHSEQWREIAAKQPLADSLATQIEGQLRAAPDYALTLFPAMLALESMAALALAWALYHRVGRARLGPPLARLRDFRFSDHMVWGLIAGLLMVVSGSSPFVRIGANLLLFFGVLYALRGTGVVLWFLAPGRLVMALLIGFALLFWYILGMLALGVGVGDTWLDWRRRVRTKT
jgi:hypothetical protein